MKILKLPAERPKEYKKGPSVMSKSARTQRRYQKAFRGQGKLTDFGFMAPQSNPHLQLSSAPGPSLVSKQSDTVNLNQVDWATQSPLTVLQGSRKRSASVLSDPSTDCDLHSEGELLDSEGEVLDVQDLGVIDEGLNENRSERQWDLDAVNVDPVADHDAEVEDWGAELEEVEGPWDVQNLGVVDEGLRSESENRREIQLNLDPVDVDPADHDEEVEDWEAELEEVVEGPKSHVQDWETLHTDIKKHLQKHSKTLPLSQLNQFMIICNFATLRLKGLSRTQASMEISRQWHEGQGNWFAWRVHALACHYQTFEKLPAEKRGGSRNNRSWLHDETVKRSTLNWLTSQKTGDVTPRKLQHALNDRLFAELNIAPKYPISEQTARWWLIKLGWRRTVVQKGVYMDGHERQDVVDYRNKVFLPALKEFEKRMAKYERFDLDLEGRESDIRKIMPDLEEGQQRIIIQYHDECCFHVNDDARNLW